MSKISELSDGGVIQGGDTLIAVRSGGNVKVTYGGSTTANIDGGTIDGTTIGGTTPAAGNFTTVTTDGLTSNGIATVKVTSAGATAEALTVYNTSNANNSQVDVYFGSNDYDTVGRGLRIEAGRDSGADGIATFYSVDQAEHSDYEAIKILTDGGVTLSHLGNNKLATTSTGIDVTGGIAATDDSTFTAASGDIFVTASTGSGGGRAGYRVDETSTNGFEMVHDNTDNAFFISRRSGSATPVDVIKIGRSTGDISFYNAAGTSQSLFWDASAEDLLVGKTSAALNTAGVELNSNGRSRFTRDSANVVEINRKNNNGSLVTFNKDGSSVGAIGTYLGDRLFVGTGDTNLNFHATGDAVYPSGTGGNTRDGAIDLGISFSKFKDLYLSGTANAGKVVADITGNNDVLVLKRDGGANGQLEIDFDGAYTNFNSVHGGFDFSYGGSSPLVRIDTSGNLLVGKTSADNTTAGIRLLGSVGFASFVRDGAEPVVLNRLTSDGDLIDFRKDGTTVGSIGTFAGDVYIGEGDTALRFNADNDLILPFNGASGSLATRDDAIDLGTSGGRFKDLYLSGGAYLGGTAAANKLDDYEEGTWTPVLEGNTGQSGQTYSGQTGTYTKIGRQVTCRFKLTLSAEGTFTNAYILLAGLPFALASSPNTVHMGNLYFTDMGTNFISIGLQGYEGNSKAYLWGKKSATASREYVGINDFSNTSSLTGTFTYFV